MKFIGIAAWVTLAFYSALCIWIPEIRIWWAGSDTRVGTLSYIGLALFFWSPVLAITGLISEKNYFVLYFVMLLAGLLTMIGYLLDASES